MSDSTRPCFVCATPTAVRCSSCAQYGITIPWCGAKCQRLVHKVHKRACGEHAHPFRLPPLDASDIAQLERNNTIMQSFSRWIPNQGVSFTWKEFTRYISAPPAPDDLFRWFRLNLWIRQIDNHTRPSGILSPKQDLSTVFWQIPNAYLDSSRPPAISA